jgi:hypothetical protein
MTANPAGNVSFTAAFSVDQAPVHLRTGKGCPTARSRPRPPDPGHHRLFAHPMEEHP